MSETTLINVREVQEYIRKIAEQDIRLTVRLVVGGAMSNLSRIRAPNEPVPVPMDVLRLAKIVETLARGGYLKGYESDE